MNANDKHTPGPWHANAIADNRIVGDENTAADKIHINGGNRTIARVYRAKDASLIKAAPEMLAALRAITDLSASAASRALAVHARGLGFALRGFRGVGLRLLLLLARQRTAHDGWRARCLVIGRGSRVTGEPRSYFDGTPNPAWPNPQYVGTVRKLDEWHGNRYARVRFDSGRTEWVNVSTLSEVSS